MSSKGFKPPRRSKKEKYNLGDSRKVVQEVIKEKTKRRYERSIDAHARLERGEITEEEYLKICSYSEHTKADSIQESETSIGGLRSHLDRLILDVLDAAMQYRSVHQINSVDKMLDIYNRYLVAYDPMGKYSQLEGAVAMGLSLIKDDTKRSELEKQFTLRRTQNTKPKLARLGISPNSHPPLAVREKDEIYKGLKIRHLRYLLGSINDEELDSKFEWLKAVRAEIIQKGRLINNGKIYSSQYIWNRCSKLCHLGVLDHEDGWYRFGPRYFYAGGLNVFKEKTRKVKWSDAWTDDTVMISGLSTLQRLGIEEEYIKEVVLKLEKIAEDFNKKRKEGIESRMNSEVDENEIKEIYYHPLFIIDPSMIDNTEMKREDLIMARDLLPYHSSMVRILPKKSIKRETRIERSRKASR